jgi:hypothetical protein
MIDRVTRTGTEADRTRQRRLYDDPQTPERAARDSRSAEGSRLLEPKR